MKAIQPLKLKAWAVVKRGRIAKNPDGLYRVLNTRGLAKVGRALVPGSIIVPVTVSVTPR